MSSSRITVAFVLERVLDQCAEDLNGRPARISEIADLADRFHDPVLRAVEYLIGADDDPIDASGGKYSFPAQKGEKDACGPITVYRIDKSYQGRAIAAVKGQLAKAGARLAFLLRENLK